MKRFMVLMACMPIAYAWAMEKEFAQASQPPQKKQKVTQSVGSAFSVYMPAKREHRASALADVADLLLGALDDIRLESDESSAAAGPSRFVKHAVVSMGYHKHTPLPGEMHVGPFACPWPGCMRDGMVTEKDVADHVRSVHISDSGSTGVTCPVPSCNKSFGAMRFLIYHLRGVHALGGRPYVCAKCKCDFTQKSHCAIHIEGKHHGSKCACSCGQKFRYSSDLLKHVRRGNGGAE